MQGAAPRRAGVNCRAWRHRKTGQGKKRADGPERGPSRRAGEASAPKSSPPPPRPLFPPATFNQWLGIPLEVPVAELSLR